MIASTRLCVASSGISFERFCAEIQVVVAAQAILDRALVQDRVQDVAARPQAGPERLGDRLGDAAALVLVGQPREPGERFVERELARRRARR